MQRLPLWGVLALAFVATVAGVITGPTLEVAAITTCTAASKWPCHGGDPGERVLRTLQTDVYSAAKVTGDPVEHRSYDSYWITGNPCGFGQTGWSPTMAMATFVSSLRRSTISQAIARPSPVKDGRRSRLPWLTKPMVPSIAGGESLRVAAHPFPCRRFRSTKATCPCTLGNRYGLWAQAGNRSHMGSTVRRRPIQGIGQRPPIEDAVQIGLPPYAGIEWRGAVLPGTWLPIVDRSLPNSLARCRVCQICVRNSGYGCLDWSGMTA